MRSPGEAAVTAAWIEVKSALWLVWAPSSSTVNVWDGLVRTSRASTRGRKAWRAKALRCPRYVIDHSSPVRAERRGPGIGRSPGGFATHVPEGGGGGSHKKPHRRRRTANLGPPPRRFFPGHRTISVFLSCGRRENP